MKTLKHMAALAFIMLFTAFQSCYNDYPPPLEPINPEDVSFVTHILPIMDKSCNTANCHDGTTPPNLLGDNAWSALRNQYVNTTIPRESFLYKSVEYLPGGDPMPPGGPQIPELDRQLILAWIQNGAPND